MTYHGPKADLAHKHFYHMEGHFGHTHEENLIACMTWRYGTRQSRLKVLTSVFGDNPKYTPQHLKRMSTLRIFPSIANHRRKVLIQPLIELAVKKGWVK